MTSKPRRRYLLCVLGLWLQAFLPLSAVPAHAQPVEGKPEATGTTEAEGKRGGGRKARQRRKARKRRAAHKRRRARQRRARQRSDRDRQEPDESPVSPPEDDAVKEDAVADKKLGDDAEAPKEGEEEEAVGDAPGQARLQRSSSMEFDPRLIRGQSAGEGAVILLNRGHRELPSLTKPRRRFLDATLSEVLERQGSTRRAE